MFVRCFGTMHTLLMSDSGQRRLANSHYYQYKSFRPYINSYLSFLLFRVQIFIILVVVLANANINQLFVIISRAPKAFRDYNNNLRGVCVRVFVCVSAAVSPINTGRILMKLRMKIPVRHAQCV